MKRFFFSIVLLLICLRVSAQQTTETSQKTPEQIKRDQDWANFQKAVEERYHNDWAWMKRYEEDNQKLPAPAPGEQRVVFMGNSITQGWIETDPEFFKTNKYINRGIGGQTTPQMLVRFRADVINLKPAVVIILAGINDIAGNTGPTTLETIFGNIVSMAELAKVNKIKVVLSSILPAYEISWKKGIEPAEKVIKLNSMLKEYAAKNNLGYVDYHTPMADERKGLPKDLAEDGIHPTLKGYKIMEPLAVKAINAALKKK
ncbi:MAG: hypothetical protein EOP47_22520 [Sphingobacteriaceae bacterium]|nr:MAG: hypothetical protein EOP47_22520 [Sphingobacteriaceae bacterium]